MNFKLKMNCHKCQSKLPENSKFCLACGEKVELDFNKNLQAFKEINSTLALLHSFFEKNPEIHNKWLKFVKKEEKKY